MRIRLEEGNLVAFVRTGFSPRELNLEDVLSAADPRFIMLDGVGFFEEYDGKNPIAEYVAWTPIKNEEIRQWTGTDPEWYLSYCAGNVWFNFVTMASVGYAKNEKIIVQKMEELARATHLIDSPHSNRERAMFHTGIGQFLLETFGAPYRDVKKD